MRQRERLVSPYGVVHHRSDRARKRKGETRTVCGRMTALGWSETARDRAVTCGTCMKLEAEGKMHGRRK